MRAAFQPAGRFISLPTPWALCRDSRSVLHDAGRNMSLASQKDSNEERTLHNLKRSLIFCPSTCLGHFPLIG